MFDEYLTQLTNNNNSKVWTIMCRINFQNRYLRGFWLHFVIVLEFKLFIYTCIPEEFFQDKKLFETTLGSRANEVNHKRFVKQSKGKSFTLVCLCVGRVKLKINGPGPSLGIHFLAWNCDTKSVSLNVFENGRQIGGLRFSWHYFVYGNYLWLYLQF